MYRRAGSDKPPISSARRGDSLRALEPLLPAPPEQLLGPEELADKLALADAADGQFPHFLSEQRPPKSPERLAAEARAAREARGQAACGKGGPLSDEEFADMCHYLDPTAGFDRGRKRYT